MPFYISILNFANILLAVFSPISFSHLLMSADFHRSYGRIIINNFSADCIWSCCLESRFQDSMAVITNYLQDQQYIHWLNLPEWLWGCKAKLIEYIKGVDVVGDKDDLVAGRWLDKGQETVQWGKYSGQFRLKTNQWIMSTIIVTYNQE